MMSQRITRDANKNTGTFSSIMRLPNYDNINNIPYPLSGSLVLNRSDLLIYYYDSTAWIPLSPGGPTSLANVGTDAGGDLVPPAGFQAGPALTLRGLRSGTGITVSQFGLTDVTITNTDPGSAVTLTNAGVAVGNESLVADGVGPALATKGLVGGTGITLTANATDVTVTNADPGSAVTLTNAGVAVGNESLVADGVGPALATKGLVGQDGITVTANATDVTVSAAIASLVKTYTVGNAAGILKGDSVSLINNLLYPGYSTPTSVTINGGIQTQFLQVTRLQDRLMVAVYTQTTGPPAVGATIPRGFVMAITHDGTNFIFGTPTILPCTSTVGAQASRVGSIFSITSIDATSFAVAYIDTSSGAITSNRIAGGTISGFVSGVTAGTVNLSTLANTVVVSTVSITNALNFIVSYLPGSTTGTNNYCVVALRNQTAAIKEIDFFLVRIGLAVPANPLVTTLVLTGAPVRITPVALTSAIGAFSLSVVPGTAVLGKFMIFWTNATVSPTPTNALAAGYNVTITDPAGPFNIALIAAGTIWDTSVSPVPVPFGSAFVGCLLDSTLAVTAKVILAYRDTDLNTDGRIRVFNLNLVTGAITFTTPTRFLTGDVPAASPWTIQLINGTSYKTILCFQDGGNASYGKSIIITTGALDAISLGRMQRFSVRSTQFQDICIDSTNEAYLFYQVGFNNPTTGAIAQCYATYIASFDTVGNLVNYTRHTGNQPIGLSLDKAPLGGQARVVLWGLVNIPPDPGNVNPTFGNFVPGEIYWLQGDNTITQQEQAQVYYAIPIEAFRATGTDELQIVGLGGA